MLEVGDKSLKLSSNLTALAPPDSAQSPLGLFLFSQAIHGRSDLMLLEYILIRQCLAVTSGHF